MYALMTLAQTISVWMTTVMSIHRFIGVCVPFKAGLILTSRNVKISIASVIIASIFFNTTRFFEVFYLSTINRFYPPSGLVKYFLGISGQRQIIS